MKSGFQISILQIFQRILTKSRALSKKTVKISSIFVAFLENMNFIELKEQFDCYLQAKNKDTYNF